MPDFLLEIGCEEIPARMINAASLELREKVSKLLERERLPASGDVSYLDSPRRLAVLAAGIPAAQPNVTEQVNGPSVAVAFKNGEPTPAAHAFAKKTGVDLSSLEKVTTLKGEYLSARITKKGRRAAEVLSELLPAEINALYWPKNMYWREPNEKFVRPVRWLVAMLDREVIPLEFDGIRAGNASRGHRLLADATVPISSAGEAYVSALRSAKVLGRADREDQIRKALDAAMLTNSGARGREDQSLLDTVVNLTEWPSAILGTFDREFLELPEEVLVTVMRDHQKYFAVEDASGKLLPHFLAVLNTDGDPQGIIRHGHERVLRARFNDARFFWQTDQKHPLRERTTWLKHVTFQKDLGSYYEKTLRVQRLCSWLCEIIRQSEMAIRPGVVHKAAYLAKTDLTTELVKEFTELQGIVGGLYACVQELDADMPDTTRQVIAQAIYDQYKPESMEDSVPRTPEGAVLSIADKADTIAGMFALGLQPTGSKDPFALRRQANGIVKIIAEHKLPLELSEIVRSAGETYRGSEAERKFKEPIGSSSYANSLHVFFRERLDFYLKEIKGYSYDVVSSALLAAYDRGDDNVGDIIERCRVGTQISTLPEFKPLFVSFKRIKNIVRQAREKGYKIGTTGNYEAQEDARLWQKIEELAGTYLPFRKQGKYLEAFAELVKLRGPIDEYFDNTMVMVEDNDELRASRLGLLNYLVETFTTILDISEIVTEGKG